jgi:adenylate cyclase
MLFSRYGVMSELIFHSGTDKIFTHTIEKTELTIGRAPENDIPIPEHTISRQHAVIRKTLRGYLLRDLGSHNGTFLNGSTITEHLLKHGDKIRMGAVTMVFRDGASQALSHDESPKTIILEAPHRSEAQVIDLAPCDDEGLLARVNPPSPREAQEPGFGPGARQADSGRSSPVDLEKSNKILYVLYQISRKLNTVPDFDALLNTIMDSIFQVIDADHGFVALLGDDSEELIPKVVRHKTPRKNPSQELRVSRTILNKVIHEKASVLTSNAMEDARFQGAKSIFVQNIRSVMCVPLRRKDEVIGIIQLDSFRLSNQYTKADLDLLTTISNQMAMVIEQANLNEKIRWEMMARQRLERFHSPEVVDLIIHRQDVDEEAMMAPDEKMVTVLFTDIVNFTPFSERLSPGEVSLQLNQYFGEMTDIVFKYSGTLDKYIGDAIMAVFGAPIEREDDAQRAIQAALDMRRAVFQMMERTEPNRQFSVRLGINTGKAVAGNLGSPRRMEYSVIGDTVNTAARIQSIAEPNQILIGEKTYEKVKGRFNMIKIGKKSVKGKSKAVTVYEVVE